MNRELNIMILKEAASLTKGAPGADIEWVDGQWVMCPEIGPD